MASESRRGRVLGLGVAKLACDVDPSEERPTFTLLIVNGAGEGLVARGRFDAFRRAVASLVKAEVPLPEPEFLWGPTPLRPGVGLSPKELEWRRAAMEVYFDAAYRRFSDRSKKHQAVLADGVLQFTFLREQDAAQLEDLMSSKNDSHSSAETSALNEIDDDDDDDQGSGTTKQKKVRFSSDVKKASSSSEGRMTPKKTTSSSPPKGLPPPPSPEDLNRRSLLLCDDARPEIVLVMDDMSRDEPRYALRIAVPRHFLSLVSVPKPFSHFQSLQEIVATRTSSTTTFSRLPAFPTSPASQRLGFRLTPAQVELRRSQLQTYLSTLVAIFPEFSADDQETIADALDVTIDKWSLRRKGRTDVREMIETDLDVDLMVRVERDHEAAKDSSASSGSSSASRFFGGGSSSSGAGAFAASKKKKQQQSSAQRKGWWARLQGDDEESHDEPSEDDGKEERKEEPARRVKATFFSAAAAPPPAATDPRLLDDEPPWGRQDDEVFGVGGTTTATSRDTSKEDVVEEEILDAEEKARRFEVLPRAMALTKELRAAEICVIVEVEAITNLAKAVDGYASKSPRWYARATVLEDGVVIQDPKLIRRTPLRKGDHPEWLPFAPLVFPLPDAPDDRTWARRSVKFEVYDANLLPSLTSSSSSSSSSSQKKTKLPLSGDLDLDHPSAMVCSATLQGLTEFEFAEEGPDKCDYEDPCFTSLSLDLVDADNRVSNGAQLHLGVCVTSAECALDYAAVGVTAVVKYETFVGRPATPALSTYATICSVCVPSFLISADGSSSSSLLPSSFSSSSSGGQSSSSSSRSMTVSNLPFDRRKNDADDWKFLGFFLATDLADPLAEVPTKFDLVRDPDIRKVAPLDDYDERLLDDYQLRHDLEGAYQFGGDAYHYAASFSSTNWSTTHTATTKVRRSVWYRLTKKRQFDQDDDDDDDPIRIQTTTKKSSIRDLSTNGNGGGSSSSTTAIQRIQRTRSTSKISRSASRKKSNLTDL